MELRSTTVMPRAPRLFVVPVLAGALAAGASAQSLQVRTFNGEVRVVQPGAEAPKLRIADTQVALPLAPRARITSLATSGERWYAAAVEIVEGRSSLALLSGRGAEVRRLPSPIAAAPLVQAPAVLLGGHGLAGLAWLEGSALDALEVRAALREGADWSTTRTVSPAGPGSQMALTAASLSDGGWLLAWSAFDGGDDEILWSRSTADGGWSAPATVSPEDNGVPDITPHLASSGGGALLAWSRFEGGSYRVQLAHYRGGRWSPPRSVGPLGSTFPRLYADQQKLLLSYRTASPLGWAIADLDPTGKVLRRAAVATRRTEDPMVDELTDRTVTLTWAGASTSERLAWRQAPPRR